MKQGSNSMESKNVSRIWTPQEKPVVLDKFCHLSLDAQKVMASMYRDFHHRKAEITRDISLQSTERDPTSRHFLDTGYSPVEWQKGGSFKEQRCMNLQDQRLYDLREQRQRNLVDHRYQGFKETRHGTLNFSGNCTVRETDNMTLCNSDKLSLPIPLVDNDVSANYVRGSKETSQECYTSDNSTLINFSTRINHTQMPEYKNSKNQKYSYESPAVESRDFEILSQFNIVDTQDDLFSESRNDSKRRSAGLLKESRLDSGESISCNKNINIDTSKRMISSDDLVVHNRNAEPKSSGFEKSGSEVSHNSVLKRSKFSKTQPICLKQPGRDTTVEKTGDRAFLCPKNGVKGHSDVNSHVHKSNGITRKVATPFCMDEGLCEESPYLERTADVDRWSHATVSSVNKSYENDSCMKTQKLKQTKIKFEKLRSDDNKDTSSVSVSGKKHFIEKGGDEIPVKKLKVTSFLTDIVYINELRVADTEMVCSEILEATEVVLCLVFANGRTQLRDNLFGTDSKTHKKQAGKVKKDLEIDSIALWKPDKVKKKVFLFSKEDHMPALHEKLREFWKILLSRDDIRKVGFQTKDVILALFTQYSFDYNRVDLSWTLLDSGIAVWLLDPDYPVSCFDKLLSALNMPEQTPRKSCIDGLQEDMVLLSSAMKKLYMVLQSKEMWTLFVCLETKLVNVLAGMERRQISISIHTLLQISTILKRNLTRLEEKAHKAAGHAFLLNSHHQLRQVLFEELQLDSHLPGKARLAKTSITRETSTSETVLTQLQPFHPLPVIILEYRQLQKLKSTYVDGILSCVNDSYLATHWDQTSAATGRLTSHHPNIQAIPKLPVTIRDHQTNFIVQQSTESDKTVLQFNARDPFISKPQWSLLAADFQQIELRLLGHLAADPVLINIFSDTNVPDIFNALAAQWLGKAVIDVTEADREQTKRVVYSVMYGVGKEKLANYLKCTSECAKAIMDSFLLKFPAVNQFTKSCVEFCQKNGYTCSIFKRRRLFPNIRHSSPALRAQAERQCVNFCVQGSAADICKAAMLQVENALAEHPKLKARLLFQIHDELLLEVADSDLNEVTGLVKNVMESEEKLCGSVVKLKVPIPVSLSVGKKWGHMEQLLAASNED